MNYVIKKDKTKKIVCKTIVGTFTCHRYGLDYSHFSFLDSLLLEHTHITLYIIHSLTHSLTHTLYSSTSPISHHGIRGE